MYFVVFSLFVEHWKKMFKARICAKLDCDLDKEYYIGILE